VANSRDCLLTDKGRVEVKGAPPGPQTLELPRYVESPVPASRTASSPSTLSAFGFASLVDELTFIGGLVGATCRSRAVAAVPALVLTSRRAGFAMLAVSLLRAPAELALPRMKLPPVAPSPALAIPNTSAR
jgi:hypothetical protein